MFTYLVKFDKVNTKQSYTIMKKIIAIAALMLGFGFTAQAQQKKAETAPKAAVSQQTANIGKLATADVETLNKAVRLTADEKKIFQELFTTKHTYLTDPGTSGSEERKGIIYKTIDAKLRATLSADKMAKLDADPALLKKLTH